MSDGLRSKTKLERCTNGLFDIFDSENVYLTFSDKRRYIDKFIENIVKDNIPDIP